MRAVAAATINACREVEKQKPLAFAELHRAGAIEYIDFPPALRGKYQSFTEADLSRLREAGYPGEFVSVEQGVAAYVKELGSR